MNQSYTKIESVLKRVNRKRKALFIAECLLLGLGALFAIAGLAVLVMPTVSGWTAMVLRVVFLAGMTTALLYMLARPFIRRENLERVARAVERANPGLNNSLINSLQLVKARSAQGAASAFSSALLQKHLEETESFLPGLDLKSAAPFNHLKRPAMFAAITAALIALALFLLPARSSTAFNALFLKSFEPPAEEVTQKTLKLTTGDFSLKYNFPQYSQIPSQSVQNSNGDIAALKGTQVIVKTRSLEPLKTASIVSSEGEKYKMEVRDQHRLKAELILSEPGTYYVEGVGTGGEKRAESGSHRMVVDEDLPPKISMLAPLSDVEVAKEDSLEVSYEASDDFGISKIELVYQRKGENRKITLDELEKDGEKRLKDAHEWRLTEMDFQPGDRIPFYLLVTDNNKVASGRTGRSETRILEIYSARKNHRKILARQDELLNRLIDHLAAHIVEAIKSGQKAAGLRETEKELVKEGEKIVDTMADLLSDMENDKFADEFMMDALSEMKSRYQGRLEKRSELLKDKSPIRDGKKKKLVSLRSTYTSDLESDILYLDKMIKKARIEDMMAEADELYEAQAELSDLLSEFKKTGDPDLLKKLRKKMAELESAFQSLMKRMSKMRKGMPEEFVNADAMKSKNVKNLSDQMQKLKKALADGDMEQAMKMADDFLSDMGKWMSAMEKNANQFGQTISRETLNKLGELEKSIQDAVKREKAIEDVLQKKHAEEVKQREERQKRIKEAGDKAEDMLKKLDESLDGAQHEFYRLKSYNQKGRFQPYSKEASKQRRNIGRSLQGMRMDLRDMGNSLQKGNLEDSLKKARNLKQKLNEYSGKAKQYSKDINARPEERVSRMNKHLKNAGQSLEKIIKALQSVKEQEGQCSAGAVGKSEMEGLAREQDALRQDVESMLERYQELKKEAPSLPGKVPRHMDEAAFKMHEASGEMKLQAPGSAQQPARQARGQLEQALQKIGKAKKKMSQSMMPGGFMSFGGGKKPKPSQKGGRGAPDPDAEVDIPDEDKYKVPGQYRDEILKAMKEEAPDQYKNLNKDYYERLVK